MRADEFSYELPEDRIAQTPIEPRDASRLMVCHRSAGLIEGRRFCDVVDYLNTGDALVINDTRVIPARLLGHKRGTGGAVEFLLLKRLSLIRWEALARPGARLNEGVCVEFGDGALNAVIVARCDGGARIVEFHWDASGGLTFEALLDRLGQMPLPPYIHQNLVDPERYQTVYSTHIGSAAAPTAGLHFTPQLLNRLEEKGVHIVRVLLHVGLGTFRPVSSENVELHEMHAEYYQMTEEAAQTINAARAQNRRIVCVGTTSVRVLETVASQSGDTDTNLSGVAVSAGSGWTNIFIKPGYKFRAVDALITNFHLPRSTLLMLVSAFWSRESILNAYSVAVNDGYRFYSFGDAMLLL